MVHIILLALLPSYTECALVTKVDNEIIRNVIVTDDVPLKSAHNLYCNNIPLWDIILENMVMVQRGEWLCTKMVTSSRICGYGV